MSDVFTSLFVYVVIPIIGIGAYLMLIKRIKKDKTPSPPILHLFWLFAIYGILIIVILTSLIWKWSGMASIGMLICFTISPVLAAISAISVSKNKGLTKYHGYTYWMSLSYVLITVPVLVIYFAFAF